jgi:hypothetical protein
MSELETFFVKLLDGLTKERHHFSILQSLVKTQRQQVRVQLAMHQQRRVQVSDLSMCPVCGKRIGSGSVFVAMAIPPPGAMGSAAQRQILVHLACRDRYRSL